MNPNVENWLNKAANDLLNVENNLKSDNVPTDTVCYHCQQATEKYLKAYLTSKNIELEKTHNLILLLEKCIVLDNDFEQLRDYCTVLNLYGPSIRYPEFVDDPQLNDAHEAFEMAIKIKEFIENTFL